GGGEITRGGDGARRADPRAPRVGYSSRPGAALGEDGRAGREPTPLRTLDPKDECDRRIVANAPTIASFLTEPAAAFYARLQTHLDRFGVPFRENPRIVRGLDYYGDTAFEFVTTKLGAQGTVMGGGRYDGLVEEMGGPPTPAVGWAAGIERLAMLLPDPPPAPKSVAVVPVGDAAQAAALDILQALRGAGIRAEMAYRGNLRRRMERANRIGARVAVVIGED